LTHRSCSTLHLERLEFLGDSILSLVISEYLHHSYPDADEGELSKRRANLVCRDSLLIIAKTWAVSDVLQVGGGERNIQGCMRSTSILADTVEACIGAVFCDAGWLEAKNMVLKHWQCLLMSNCMQQRDAKSLLQEYTQSKAWGLPEYQVTEQPNKQHRFIARCYVQGSFAGEGKGERKKQAQILAAEQAWKNIQQKQ